MFIEPPKDIWFVMGEYLPPPYGIIQLAAYLEKDVPISARWVDGIDYHRPRAVDDIHGHRAAHIPHHGAAALVYRRAPPAPVRRVLVRIEIPDGRQGELTGKGGEGWQQRRAYSQQADSGFQDRV